MTTKLKIDNENGVIENVADSGDITLRSGDNSVGAGDGGNVILEGGDGSATGGAGGAIFIRPGYGPGTPTIPTVSGVPEPSEFWFVDANATPGYVGFKAPDDVSAGSTGDGANTVWTLPEGDGTANQVMITDGGGILSWSSIAAAGGVQNPMTANLDVGGFDIIGSPPATPTSNGGDVDIIAGDSGVTSGNGGAINLTSGQSNGSDNDGGDIIISTSTGGTGTSALDAGEGGRITIQTANGANADSGRSGGGGDIHILSGDEGTTVSGFHGEGGDIRIWAGNGTDNDSQGQVSIRAGTSLRWTSNSQFSANGGTTSVLGANAAIGFSSQVLIKGGNGSPGGPVNIRSGNGLTTSAGGAISLQLGETTSGTQNGYVEFKAHTDSPQNWTPEVRFLEAATNGTDYLGLKAPDSVSNSKVFEMAVKVQTVTAVGPTAIGEDVDLVIVDASSNSVTITLHSAANERFRPLNVKRIDSTGNTITVTAGGSDTIDGSVAGGSILVVGQWTAYTLINDKGTAWYIA